MTGVILTVGATGGRGHREVLVGALPLAVRGQPVTDQ